ncbi:MAG: hypothetical protein KKA79_04510 [Nanoarchaeota archaeon]|nr:hypothetical protein [Nanoarchaeota archaeon]
MAEFNMQELKGQILELVKKNGPVLPVQISQKVASNILFTSAILSDLVRQNQVKISKAKIGSSPVYYVKGQESKLQMLYKNLKEMPKKMYDVLKEKKLVRDTDLEPWQRVAVREIKDFAMMLNVNYQDNQETFWKWYLMSQEEAKGKIVELLKKEMPKPKKEENKEIREEPKKEEVKKEVKEEKKEEKQEKLEERKEEKKDLAEFYGLVNTYFTENRIRVIEEKSIRKNSEYEFVIEIPSALGDLKYFVKAKNKKKIGDAELNMSYTLGEKQKLPTIFLSTGELTKKAEKYLDKELKGLIFKRLNSY